MSHSCGTYVPKFGSFKPRASSKIPTLPPKHETQSQRSHKRRDEHQAGEHGPDSSYRKIKRKKSSREISYQSTQTAKVKEPSPDSEPFIVDLRGDAKNVEYGSLHRYSVPAYHRFGYGAVIGAPSNVKIERDATTEKKVMLRTDDGVRKDRKLLSLKNLHLTSESSEPVDVLTRGSDQAETDLDFLSLKRKRDVEDEKPSREAGGGIWNFIEDAESSDSQEA